MTANEKKKTKLQRKDAGNVAHAPSELLFYQTEDGKTRLQKSYVPRNFKLAVRNRY